MKDPFHTAGTRYILRNDKAESRRNRFPSPQSYKGRPAVTYKDFDLRQAVGIGTAIIYFSALLLSIMLLFCSLMSVRVW